MSKIINDGASIIRFSAGSRVTHALHALAFVCLFISGFFVATRGLGGLIGVSALKNLAHFHHVASVLFIATPIIFLILSGRNLLRWLKDIFSFNKDDASYIAYFVKEFFGAKSITPPAPQGRYNGGEKLNSMLQIAGFVVMVVTGLIVAHPMNFAPATLGAAKVVHSFCGLILGAAICGHAYLGLVHRSTKASFPGMVRGAVDIKWAREHHPLWVKEVEESEKEEVK